MLFNNAGLSPNQINYVFATHFHGDHLYGLELFNEAKWLMAEQGIEEWIQKTQGKQKQANSFLTAEDSLPVGFDLVHAPGHTYGLHMLSVMTRWGRLIVTGDAVMTIDYFDNEEGYSNSVDFTMARQTVQNIKKSADLVIPGHGNIILNR
jgi:glyoxylase-like metal-dependent hydrolase (beta-lactamase superfamily II)